MRNICLYKCCHRHIVQAHQWQVKVGHYGLLHEYLYRHQKILTTFPHFTFLPYTPLIWQWISATLKFFKCKNRITTQTSHFARFSVKLPIPFLINIPSVYTKQQWNICVHWTQHELTQCTCPSSIISTALKLCATGPYFLTNPHTFLEGIYINTIKNVFTHTNLQSKYTFNNFL